MYGILGINRDDTVRDTMMMALQGHTYISSKSD